MGADGAEAAATAATGGGKQSALVQTPLIAPRPQAPSQAPPTTPASPGASPCACPPPDAAKATCQGVPQAEKDTLLRAAIQFCM